MSSSSSTQKRLDTIVYTTMSYTEEIPPRWSSIVEIVAEVFNISSASLITYGHASQENRHLILYQSPCLLNPTAFEFIFLVEFHDSEICRKANADLIDQEVVAHSLLCGEGVSSTRFKPEAPLGTRQFYQIVLLKTYLISSHAESQLQAEGWDFLDHNAVSEPDPSVHTGPAYLGLKLQGLEGTDPSSKETKRKIYEEIDDCFPLRTSAITETVQKIITYRHLFTGKVFFITGASHLIQRDDHPKFSLTSLYQILRTIPVLVLCPVNISSSSGSSSPVKKEA